MELFEVDSVDSGPAYFQPTGIFEVTRPKPKKKKYKKVDQRVKPVPTTLPEEFRIIREITGDPLADIPILSTHPPDFHPTGRYTQENHDIIEENHPGDFLWPDERKLMHHFMMLQESGFAWDESQKGKFREDFFPPVTIPVIEHIPWVHKNIPIPPGLYHEVIDIVKDKIASGIYEPSSSSYRSKWFTVFKKDGRSLRIVHDLQPLNAVTIRNSGVPPLIEQLAETFGARACYGVFDLFVAFDQRLLSVKSRDLTTFQTPLGTFRLSMLPMGWTNSMQVLQGDITYTLQDEIPDVTIPFVDDAGVKGPITRYETADGGYETIPENSGIRRFVWEHFQNLNRVVQRMKYAGCTWSGKKAYLCVPEAIIVGHKCTYEGRIPEDGKVDKIKNWGPCLDLTDVRSFLGTAGILRIYVRNYSLLARPLVNLTRKGVEFFWGPDQEAAQEALKQEIINSPALRPIDYKSDAPVILAVDTSAQAVGYAIFQEDPANPKRRYPSRFGSIPLNSVESKYSQPKLELYGLYRALKEAAIWIIGVKNFVVEVDATAIKGMINNPDMNPSAVINRWVAGILLFDFKLVHIPGVKHGVDGLSRRRPQPGDEPAQGDDPDWVDKMYGFVHIINPLVEERASGRKILSPMRILANRQIHPQAVDPIPADADIEIPRSAKAKSNDARVLLVQDYLSDFHIPASMTEDQKRTFINYASGFFLLDDNLWKRDSGGEHKLVVPADRRYRLLQIAHDELGHKGVYSVRTHLLKRYWWPQLLDDVKWFVKTCHMCQIRQTDKWHIPPVVAYPAPLFSKVYIDTFHLPKSNGFKYIVHARCSMSAYPEFKMLRHENAEGIARFIFEHIICRWGSLREIVTDNGTAFLAALEILAAQYDIHHITISAYNSQAQGVIERRHRGFRESLFKACGGVENKWSQVAHAVIWAERVTPLRTIGKSPYEVATGVEPILPLDIAEASYLVEPPTTPISTSDLIARRAVTLQKRPADLERIRAKVYDSRVKTIQRWEKEHANRIIDWNFQPGALVLVRNTRVEYELSRKFKPRYLGPLVYISKNRGGALILCDLDGTVLADPIAAFRCIPYYPRDSIPIPDLADFIDQPLAQVEALERTTDSYDDGVEDG